MRRIETVKTNACGDRNFGHTASIVYVDVCRGSMNCRMRLKIRLLDNTDTGDSSVFNLRLRIAEYVWEKKRKKRYQLDKDISLHRTDRKKVRIKCKKKLIAMVMS